jgi:drug/metabolite transporter (DMT)-like permease
VSAEATERPRVDWLGVGLVIASAAAFSAKAIFVKLAYAVPGGVDPLTLLAMRMMLAFPLFAVIAWWAGRNAEPLTGREWRLLATLGLMGYYGASLFDFWGLQYITAALERLILFLNPTLVVLISALFMGYHIGRRDLFALGISYVGIALVFLHDLRVNFDGVILGSSLVLMSAVLYAGYLVGAGHMVRRLGGVRFAAYASLVSTAAIVVHIAFARELSAFDLPARVWSLAGWMALVSTVLPILLMAEGMRRVGASSAAMMSSIGPVATIFMGHLFLNEAITGIQLAGAALVVGGVLVISLKKTGIGKR